MAHGMKQTRMPANEDMDKVLPPSPRSPHLYGSPEGMTYSSKMASPRAKTSPRTRMLKKWPRKDERRMLNVLYRVGNIQDSIEYYQECLGMHVLRRIDFPEDKYLTVFMGYGLEDNHLIVELTYNYGVTKYDIGNGLGHFGLAVPSVQATLDEIRKKGFPAPASTSVDLNNNVYAMLKDPDGYPFKLIQRAGMRERLWQVSFKVTDIGATILFYQDVKPWSPLNPFQLLHQRINSIVFKVGLVLWNVSAFEKRLSSKTGKRRTKHMHTWLMTWMTRKQLSLNWSTITALLSTTRELAMHSLQSARMMSTRRQMLLNCSMPEQSVLLALYQASQPRFIHVLIQTAGKLSLLITGTSQESKSLLPSSPESQQR